MNEKVVVNFMGWRKVAAIVSLLLMIASVAALVRNGLAFGLDFTGGTQVEVGYESPADLIAIRETLEKAGFINAVVVNFGTPNDVLVRLPQDEANEGKGKDKLGSRLLEVLQSDAKDKVELRRIEFVGPQVGEELRDEGGLALIVALGCVMLYVAFRFQFKFSIGAVAALIHDVLITVGIFAIFKWDFDLTVLAALLAVIGYSLNDTIVVSDRIRENFRKLRKGSSEYIVNVSLTETLARTLVTSLTTLLVLCALFFAGGEMIHGFSKALIIGVLVGTYSSIYVASNMLLVLNIDRSDLMLPVKEGAEFDDGLP
ncbi:MAG: protein translocase subunit SecF [Pseudomonadales bacterium]